MSVDHAERRPVAGWLLVAMAAVAVAGVGTGAALARSSTTPPLSLTAASSSASIQQLTGPLFSAGQGATSRPWRLFVHCGAPVILLDGRAWAPVAPVPSYPGPRPVNGISIYTGYTNGTLTVLSSDRLRFTASDTASPYSLTYAPAPPSNSTAPACA